MSYYETLTNRLTHRIGWALIGFVLLSFNSNAFSNDLIDSPFTTHHKVSCADSLTSNPVPPSTDLTVSLLPNSANNGDVALNFQSKLAPYFRELHSFIQQDQERIANFDFLTSSDFKTLADLLLANKRLSNQVAIQITKMERKGMTPRDPISIVRALVTLSTIANGHRYDACNSETGCHRSMRSKGLCVSGTCTPKVSQEFIFSIDNEILPVWHFEFPVHLKLWGHELVLWERRELEVDENSQAIRTLSATGGSYLTMILNAAKLDALRNRPWVFIYMDLNNLGLINYFQESHAAGDAYIKAFSNTIRRNLTKSDHFFRIGGDEFVIVGENRPADTVPQFINHLVEQFFEDVKANHLFHKQWKFFSEGINAIPKFANYEQLETSPYMRLLEGSWQKVAASDWNLFLEKYKSHYQSQLLDKYHTQKFLLTPTFSVGSKIIQTEDTLESLKELTSSQSALCKRYFKEAQGDCAEKYGGASENPELQKDNIQFRRTIRPEALPPL